MLIKERVYKTFKKIAKAIQVTSSLNEHIQKYAGKNLPSTFVVRCNFTPVDQTGYKIRITHG